MRQQQSILITGCSTGIGRALAQELAARGHTVFATARRPEMLDDVASDHLIPLQLDVLNQDSIERAVSTAVERAGRIDILINNAGVTATSPLAETPLSRLRKIVDTNLTAPIAMTQAVFPTMADQDGGRIVNVGSVVGVLPTPFTATYCATKAGLHMLSDALRMELHPFNIDVVTVQPAAVGTAIEDRGAEGIEAFDRPESRYHPYAASIRKRAEGPKAYQMPAAEFARIVAPKMLADRPPRVIRAGGQSGLLQALARLPVALREPSTRRQFGL